MLSDIPMSATRAAPSVSSIRELMADPIVHMLMKSDGISANDVWAAVAMAQRRPMRMKELG